jgi:AcrR family transcriptional regulator
MNGKATRDDIVEAADGLFYRRGFDHTSFADIAETVRISRGNFYYYFKTKDEILDAVIERRLMQTRGMLDQWEVAGDTPAARLRSFIDMLIANRTDIKRYGCPVGTLCTELVKIAHPSQARAHSIFELFRAWLRRQFELLGDRDADAHSLHVLARSQGVAVLASTYRDKAFVEREVNELLDWLAQVCARPPAAKRRKRRSR